MYALATEQFLVLVIFFPQHIMYFTEIAYLCALLLMIRKFDAEGYTGHLR
jgi:hypothetical protein